MQRFGRRLQRSFFDRDVDEVARDLLGRVIAVDHAGLRVAVRLTEVEAYAGLEDPASHAFRGRTPRSSIMFGPAGHLYTYFVYGMHWCANIVAGPVGDASAVLLRAGEVVDGVDTARLRRSRVTRDTELARGPAGLATVLAFDASSNGTDLCRPDGEVALFTGEPPLASAVRIGPRVGVAAAAEIERRFWIEAEPSVSAFRAWTPRKRTAGPAAALRKR